MTFRHTNAILFTSMIPTKPHFLITIGPYVHTKPGLLQLTISISLKVPAIRSVLEYLKYVSWNGEYSALSHSYAFISSFMILFILFVITIEFNEPDQINTAEGVFMIYALGFALEKVAAMQEHGIKGTEILHTFTLRDSPFVLVYFKGTWVSNLSRRRALPTLNTSTGPSEWF